MRFSPGCNCCDEPDTPCCGASTSASATEAGTTPGLIPTTLVFSDGFGDIPLTFNGPRPVSVGAPYGVWWGCTTRSCSTARAARDAFGGCTSGSDSTLVVEIAFAFFCQNGQGFRLAAYHFNCSYFDDGTHVQQHMMPGPGGCTGPWPGHLVHVLAGSLNGIEPADCSPFIWGPHSQSFPNPDPSVGTGVYHPLRGIYGATGTWTISA